MVSTKAVIMIEEPSNETMTKIEKLRVEHRDLDEVLSRLCDDHNVDQLQIRRLKKRKLQLKDTITRLESQLLPNMLA